ncbi:MAG: helix-turn-helix domain-containing protein [Mangrovibacterium sp.]
MEHHPKDGVLQTLLPSGAEISGWQYYGKWELHLNDKSINIQNTLPDFYLVGQQTISYKLTAQKGLAGIFGAALWPGTIFRLTGKPAHLFTNNPLGLGDAFEGTIVQNYISDFKKSANDEQRLQVLIDFFRQFRAENTTGIFNEAMQLIYTTKGCISVSELCGKLHINERYLQRQFKQKVGVTPLAYLQIIRFNNVFAQLSSTAEDMPIEPLAMMFRYYDISHFNKAHKKYFLTAPSKLMLDKLALLRELIAQDPYLLQIQKKYHN